MKDNLVETLVGAAVLVVAAMFVIYGYSVTEADGGDGYSLNAQFDRVDGLTIGSDVRMSGIKIGTVTALQLDPQSYYANAEFTIGGDIELPTIPARKLPAKVCSVAIMYRSPPVAAKTCCPRVMKFSTRKVSRFNRVGQPGFVQRG